MKDEWHDGWRRFVTAALLLIAVLFSTDHALADDTADQELLRSDARSQTHALLVGVSDYPYLDPSAQLLGPRNDVDLWRNYLLESLPGASVRVLADGVKNAGMPTRKAILAELDRLAADVVAGDFVFLMFAGHGAQQPASERSLRDEPDGLDEIFLPRDARGWDSSQASVENAIVDTEFKQAIDSIRDKGAFVWAVFDTCHSATMTRAVKPSSVRYRQLSPGQLGIPVEVMSKARDRSAASPSVSAVNTTEVSAPSGQMVAFYAAQSHQATPEFALPLGAIDARDHGVFSFALLQVLQEAPQASYTELIERVMQRLQVTPGASAVPMAEGTAMADQVWGGGLANAAPWRVTRTNGRLTLSAGRMHDQAPGSTLKLYENPDANDNEPLASVVVTQARSVDADVELLEAEGSTPDIAALPEVMYARAWQTRIDWRLKVALAPQGQAQCDAPSTVLNAALDHVRNSPELSRRVQWVDADTTDVDLWLCPRNARIELLEAQTPSTVQAPGIGLPARGDALTSLAESIGDALSRASRVASVLRVAQATGAGRAIAVRAWVRKRPGAGEMACDQLASPEPVSGSTAYEPGTLMSLQEGDCLSLVLHNKSQTPVDLTILFVDAGFGMSVLWPDSQQMFNPRIEADGKVAIGEFEAYADSLGRDRLLVLALPVLQASQPVSLAFLAQDSIDNSIRTRGQQDPFTALMIDVGFSDVATRSLRPARGGGQPMSAQVFSLHVSPD